MNIKHLCRAWWHSGHSLIGSFYNYRIISFSEEELALLLQVWLSVYGNHYLEV